MLIHEAILATTKDEPYITRQAWSYNTGKPATAVITILPTNTPDCCVITSKNGRIPCRGWQPAARDLIADDWMVTKGV